MKGRLRKAYRSKTYPAKYRQIAKAFRKGALNTSDTDPEMKRMGIFTAKMLNTVASMQDKRDQTRPDSKRDK